MIDRIAVLFVWYSHLRQGGNRTMAQATVHARAHPTTTTLRPLHDRVLVKRLEEQEARHGSIFIPDSAQEKPQEGRVIAVGTGKVTDDGARIPMAVKEGDRILFG